MKHFFGGYALGFIVLFFWGLERARANGRNCAILGLALGWVFGLAAWGLLP